MKRFNLLFLALIASSLLVSCEKDAPIIPNEEELITTVTYRLTPDDGGDVVEFSFEDLDGEGGEDAIISTAPLAANTSYSAELDLLNKSEGEEESITEEIEEEAVDHQFFFSSDVESLVFSYDDLDENGLPIGLKSKLVTGDESSGTITITLKHKPEKTASGVAQGDIANAGGETDIEVNFNFDVQ